MFECFTSFFERLIFVFVNAFFYTLIYVTSNKHRVLGCACGVALTVKFEEGFCVKKLSN